MKKIITIIGARPQFTKCAVVSKNLRNNFNEILIHTGQHYDYKMSESFFEELKIPAPDYNLNIGGMSHAKMTAHMMLKLEEIIEKEKPDGIMTFGDTDSTLAAGLVAAKLYIPLIHIEAGERIYNKNFVPEEINRVVVDHISNLNLCSTEDALIKLSKEGINNAVFVGDPMYDLYILNKNKIKSNIVSFKKKLNLPDKYALLTIHRVENTMNEDKLFNILSGLLKSEKFILWPIHPRTKNLLNSSEKLKKLALNPKLKIVEPLPYIDFSTAIALSSIVVSDSGGVIRESYFADKFSIVPLQNSWWKNIVMAGWSIETKDNEEQILSALNKYWNYRSIDKPPFFGNGDASKNITQTLLKYFN